MGLGALNKAEFINHGGEDILSVFQPTKTRCAILYCSGTDTQIVCH